MLRLLRRIREQTHGDLPPGVTGLENDDLSVIYVESTAEGVRFRPLRVSDDGDFIDRWPHGFFDERAEELFTLCADAIAGRTRPVNSYSPGPRVSTVKICMGPA